MKTLKLNKKYNPTAAENELFSWDFIQADYLTYKPTGKQIYQMKWYEWQNSQPITDQTIVDAVKDFWAELEIAQAQKPETKHNPVIIKRNDGWCEKCQSYCYGDCEA